MSNSFSKDLVSLQRKIKTTFGLVMKGQLNVIEENEIVEKPTYIYIEM